jgi:hypothetical protein
MKIFIIAQIYQGRELIGYRLLDVDDNNKVRDLPLAAIVKTLSNKSTANIINNASLVNGVVTGTNGQLSRYASVNVKGALIGASPLVVINQIEDLGYTVSDYKGSVLKMSNDKVVAYAKNNGIANGKIVIKDSIEYISSINGAYEKVAYENKQDKSHLKMQPMLRIYADKEASGVTTSVKSEVDLEMAYKDVFSALTKKQKKAITQYYTWYTVDVYKGLAKNVRMDIAPGKAEKLARLRGETKWVYGGVINSYLEDRYNARCELGHPLKYEHYALPEALSKQIEKEATNLEIWSLRNEGGSQALIEKGAIVFGEDCAGDFFNISPEDMKKLIKTRKTMTEEVDILSEVISNNLIDEYKNKCSMLYDIIQRLGSTENVVKIFGVKVGYTLLNFMRANVPFTKSLVILAGSKIREDKKLFFNMITNDKFNDMINIIYENSKNLSILQASALYLDYIVDYSVEGAYQYNPLTDKQNTRRDIGGYNDKTRNERRCLLGKIYSELGISAKMLNDLGYLEKYLELISTAYEISDKFEKYISNSSILNEKHNDVSNTRNEYEAGYKRNITRALEREVIDDFDIIKANDQVALDKMDIVISAAAFSNRSYYRSSLTYRTRENTGYRVRTIDKNFDNIYDRYSKFAINKDINKLIDDTLGLYERKLIKEQEEINKIESTVPKNAEFGLDWSKELEEKFKGRPVLGTAFGDISSYPVVLKNKHQDDPDFEIEMYGNIKVSVSDIISARELGKVEYTLRKQEFDRITNELEASKREAEAQAEKEKQRLEKEKLDKELAEIKKNRKSSSNSKSSSQDKKEDRQDKSDKIEIVKELLEKNKDINDYGINIARDIVKRNIPYDKLSSKQQWRINETIKQLSNTEPDTKNNAESNNTGIKVEELPKKHQLASHKEVMDKLNEIIKVFDEDDTAKIKAIQEVSSIANKIAYTMKRTGEYSDKQLKHINLAYDAITK